MCVGGPGDPVGSHQDHPSLPQHAQAGLSLGSCSQASRLQSCVLGHRSASYGPGVKSCPLFSSYTDG